MRDERARATADPPGRPAVTGGEDSVAHATRLRRTLEGALGVPFLPGNSVRWLINGQAIFPAMLDALRAARRSIEFVTFIYWSGDVARRFADALADAASRGLQVRVVLDALGAARMDERLITRMEDAGVEVRWFHPLKRLRFRRMDNRTHRKILVCDDEVAFTGGVGIAEEWEGDARDSSEWRETHARVTGPCVRPLKAAFLDNWFEAKCGEFDERGLDASYSRTGEVPVQVVRSNAGPGASDMATLLRALVSATQTELLLTTPYFYPDTQLLDLLVAATDRGVRVRVLMPDRHVDTRLPFRAGRSDWGRLLEAGVEMWLYQHTMLHAKMYLADGIASCLGSPNLNHRSLRKDAECCFVALSEELAAQARDQFERDLRSCEQVTLESWKARGLLPRCRERLVRMVGTEI